MKETASEDENVGGVCSGHCVKTLSPQIGPYGLPRAEISCEGECLIVRESEYLRIPFVEASIVGIAMLTFLDRVP